MIAATPRPRRLVMDASASPSAVRSTERTAAMRRLPSHVQISWPAGNFARRDPIRSIASGIADEEERRDRHARELGEDVVGPLERPREIERHHAVAKVARDRVRRATGDEHRDHEPHPADELGVRDDGLLCAGEDGDRRHDECGRADDPEENHRHRLDLGGAPKAERAAKRSRGGASGRPIRARGGARRSDGIRCRG